MSRTPKFTEEELYRLAGSGVAKVDLMGPRGTTLCTMDEIEAMATLIVLKDILPGEWGDADRKPHWAQLEGERA